MINNGILTNQIWQCELPSEGPGLLGRDFSATSKGGSCYWVQQYELITKLNDNNENVIWPQKWELMYDCLPKAVLKILEPVQKVWAMDALKFLPGTNVLAEPQWSTEQGAVHHYLRDPFRTFPSPVVALIRMRMPGWMYPYHLCSGVPHASEIERKFFERLHGLNHLDYRGSYDRFAKELSDFLTVPAEDQVDALNGLILKAEFESDERLENHSNRKMDDCPF